MTLFILIVVLAYLVALIDGAARLGRFLKGVEREMQGNVLNANEHRGQTCSDKAVVPTPLPIVSILRSQG